MIKETQTAKQANKAPHLPRVCAVVLNYNGIRHNSRCLHSLLEQDYPALHVLFVDNGSTDDSLSLVKNEFGNQLEYLENKENLYFAAGNNRGIRHALKAGFEYIFIVNNDTELETSCVTQLTTFMQKHPTAGGCQPLIHQLDEARSHLVASAGVRISLSGRCWDAGTGQPVTTFGSHHREVRGITGGGMFLSDKALYETCGFDESYVMYFEDVDISFRLRKAGYTLHLVPTARMGHRVAATSNEFVPLLRISLCETNSYRLIQTHFPSSLRLRSLLVSCGFTLGSAAVSLLNGDLRKQVLYCKAAGKVSSWSGNPSPHRKLVKPTTNS